MKVVVTNAVLSNSGDAAICLGIMHALHDLGVITDRRDVTVLDIDPASSSPHYPDIRILQQPIYALGRRGRPWMRPAAFLWFLLAVARWKVGDKALRGQGRYRSAFEALAEAELVVSSGGTYLVERYRIWPRVVDLLVAKGISTAPLVLWTQSLGPFHRLSSRLLIRQLLSAAHLVLLRDERSLGHLKTFGGSKASLSVIQDAAFALPFEPRWSAQPPDRRVIVSVREWDTTLDTHGQLDFKSYAGAMAGCAKHLTEMGWHVEALSTCQGVPGYAFDDSAVAAEIMRGLPVAINDGFHTPEQLMAELSGASLVITTRLHLAIMALVVGVPVLAVAYEFKTLELFQRLGLDDAVMSIDAVSADWLIERGEAILSSDGSSAELPRLNDEELRRVRSHAAPTLVMLGL